MPDFANLTTALMSRGEPARVPSFEISIDQGIKSRFLGKPVVDQATEVEFYMQAGYDFVPIIVGMRENMRGDTTSILGADADRATVFTAKDAQYNPFDEGTNTRLWAEEGSGVIRDQASFDNYPWPEPDAFNYETVESLGHLLPDGAKVIVIAGGVFTCSWMLMGMEAFCIATAEGSPLVSQLIQKIGEIQHGVVERVLDFECVGAVFMPDDLAYTTGFIVHPRILREHVFPWNQRIGRLVAARQLPYIYHSDGRIYDVIDDLLECGFHALHPCEPASMEIAELKRKYAGRLCFCGSIDLDRTLTLGTPDDVKAEVITRLRTIAPGGGFCCGASNSVPEYVPYDNYLAMIDTVDKHGTYPIDL
jgi:uroporphyrinogen decarboxylase